MAPQPQSKPGRPLGISPTRTGKQVRIEDDPEDQILRGRSHESSGSRDQLSGGNQHGHRPGDEGQRIYQPEEIHHVHSQEQGHQAHQTAQRQKTEQKPEQSHQESIQPETHEQFSAPGVGATPQTPGVYLHTSANPTMSVGYTHGYSVLPTLPDAPDNNTINQDFTQDFNPGVNPPSTTYIGPRNMTYYRNTHQQQGSRYHPLGLHFQPPVPDTTYGPMTHVYVPRHDPPGLHAPGGGPVQVRDPFSNAQTQWPIARPLAYAPMVVQPATAQVPAAHAGFVPLQPQVGIGANPALTVHHQSTIPAVHPPYAGHMQYPGQPAMFGGQVMPGTYPSQPAQGPFMYAPTPAAAVPSVPGVPGFPGFPGSAMAHFPPDVTGVGKTINEIQAHHREIALANGILEPEDFQPASTDPSKMYYCRELDGNWTLRSRYSIDKMGDWRWFQTPEGAFYAVRLPN